LNTATPTAHGEEAQRVASGPGQLLKSTRESAGISIRDVSAQLRLDERTVAALEADDFGHLPAPTFVRGYLRGYARLLGVPVGPVMEAYDREGFAPPGLVADISDAPQANASDFPVRLTTIAVIVVLAALVVLWWNNQAFDEPDRPATAARDTLATTEDAAAAQQEPAGAASEPAPTTTRPANERPPSPLADQADPAPSPAPEHPPRPSAGAGTPTTAGPPVDEVIAQAESVLQQTRGELDAMAGSAGGDSTREPATIEHAPGAAPASPATGDARSSTPPDTTNAAAGGAGNDTAAPRLVMTFPVEAWVEVNDGNDRRLFFGLVQPGRTLEFEAPPPVRVLLGRTRGVSVRYRGETVDLGPYTEKGVARFTLEQ
jgi:cytoskeleton protein RodZ